MSGNRLKLYRRYSATADRMALEDERGGNNVNIAPTEELEEVLEEQENADNGELEDDDMELDEEEETRAYAGSSSSEYGGSSSSEDDDRIHEEETESEERF